nr:probable ATP-dependent RNA helicase Dbp73D [Onthophagus taurus]
MDLFVINRHEDNKEDTINEEANLKKLLKKIKKKKELKNIQKDLIKDEEEIVEKPNNEITPNEEDSNNQQENDLEIESENIEPPIKQKKIDPKDVEGFTILGGEQFDKKTKVKRVLPKWLSNPIVISVDLQNLTNKVSHIENLDKSLKKQLKLNGIKYLFPVQAAVIPWVIKSIQQSSIVIPKDICVSAPTGSGKTLAFVLPVIQALLKRTVKKIRALVILPTLDLAMQVFKCFKKYTVGTKLDVLCITGKSVFEQEQKQLVHNNVGFGYMSKVDILVCTAGRLVDHLKETPGFNLTELEYLVIDEADRVLDNIQNDWLYHLEKHINQEDNSLQSSKVLNVLSFKTRKSPQKLLFSATLSQDPEKLQKLSLFEPILFTSIVENDANEEETKKVTVDNFIGKYTTPKELTEKYIISPTNLKPLVLYEFIKSNNLTKTIVFTHSLEATHRLSILLKVLFNETLKIKEISSNLDIKNRKFLIEDFSKGNIDILVCTDALARGIDLPGIQCVISYSPPKYLKTYIHRAGRTARAGEFGMAVTILPKPQLNRFLSLLQQADKNNLEEIFITEDNLEALGDKYKEALNELKKAVGEEEEKSLNKMKSARRVVKRKRKINDE